MCVCALGRMNVAVANMRGVEKLFSESTLTPIQHWLSSYSEEKRLEQIFLVTLQ